MSDMSSALAKPYRRVTCPVALVIMLTLAGVCHAAPPGNNAVPPGAGIVALVNADVISKDDLDSRTRLFAMSTGLPMSSDVLDRLKPQILRQLVDERLRIQEARNRKVVVSDKDIAAAIRDIEGRNRFSSGTLRQKLAAAGISQRTLIDQIRAQLGWTQVLREALGEKLVVTDSDIEDQQRLRAQQTGQQEYRLGEIFIPIDDPANTADAQRFAETVIKELRAGAPFPLVAAQFSQTQTALEGGEVGWVQTNQMDPEVARLMTSMPVGAVSNPVKVAGGFSIVTLQGKRELGRELATAITLRQLFLPFTAPLNPQAPTEQQRQLLDKARSLSNSVNGCDQIEQIAKTTNSPGHPVDPGELRLEGINPPPFRQLLATLPIGKASQPLVSNDGIAVVVVCGREQKNMAMLSKQDVQRQIIGERVELLSRQMLRDLRRQANIDIRARGA
jgi:peptidyl-prolyl cis-trans isomerase SurA